MSLKYFTITYFLKKNAPNFAAGHLMQLRYLYLFSEFCVLKNIKMPTGIVFVNC